MPEKPLADSLAEAHPISADFSPLQESGLMAAKSGEAQKSQ